MSKLVIVPRCQYGYNTDYFQMANRLAEKNVDIEMICFDQGHRKMEAAHNVNVTYVERKASKAGNFLRYITTIMKYILQNKKDIHWVVVSGTIEFCGILPFLLKAVSPNIQWILDIRTCSVVPDKRKRKVYDLLTLLSSYFFDKKTVISGLVAKRMKIKEYEVLPLGSDCYVNLDEKIFDQKNINFLYVGIFDDRKVDDLVKAFDIVSGKMGEDIRRRFDIVGFSNREGGTTEVMEYIGKSRSKEKIIFHGRKSHDEIKPLFQDATIGFSYVPVTDFFDVQPPTKTFEYIMNGIICVGTNTKANMEIITEKNGVLAEDNVPSLVGKIEKVLENLDIYNSRELAHTVRNHQWQNIVDNFHIFLKQIDMKTKESFNEEAIQKRME